MSRVTKSTFTKEFAVNRIALLVLALFAAVPALAAAPTCDPPKKSECGLRSKAIVKAEAVSCVNGSDAADPHGTWDVDTCVCTPPSGFVFYNLLDEVSSVRHLVEDGEVEADRHERSFRRTVKEASTLREEVDGSPACARIEKDEYTDDKKGAAAKKADAEACKKAPKGLRKEIARIEKTAADEKEASKKASDETSKKLASLEKEQAKLAEEVRGAEEACTAVGGGKATPAQLVECTDKPGLTRALKAIVAELQGDEAACKRVDEDSANQSEKDRCAANPGIRRQVTLAKQSADEALRQVEKVTYRFDKFVAVDVGLIAGVSVRPGLQDSGAVLRGSTSFGGGFFARVGLGDFRLQVRWLRHAEDRSNGTGTVVSEMGNDAAFDGYVMPVQLAKGFRFGGGITAGGHFTSQSPAFGAAGVSGVGFGGILALEFLPNPNFSLNAFVPLGYDAAGGKNKGQPFGTQGAFIGLLLGVGGHF